MTKTSRFLLIGNRSHSWRKTLQDAVRPLGELDVCDETQSYSQVFKKKYDVVVIDSMEIKNTEDWLGRLQSQLPSSRLIVAAAAPSWQQARAVLLAGAMDYITKSNDKDKLSRLLSELLEKPVG